MTTPASLRTWLRGGDAERLRRLLAARVDVLAGAPLRDLDDLADRLCRPNSVATALLAQALPAVQVLVTLAGSGSRATARRTVELLAPAPSSEAPDAGPSAPAVRGTPPGAQPSERASVVRRYLDVLTDAGLLWPADGAARLDDDAPWCVNPGLLALLPDPLGLGLPAAYVLPGVPARSLQRVAKKWGLTAPSRKDDLVALVADRLADPEHVRRLLGPAPDGVVAFLLQHAQRLADRAQGSTLPLHPDDGSFFDDGDAAVPFDPREHAAEQAALRWAQDHGLAYSMYGDMGGYAGYGLEIPGEVILGLLGPGPGLRFDPQAPFVPRAPVLPEQVAGAGAAAVTETLGLTMALLERLDREPLTALKSGGVGARELARLSRTLGAPPPEVRLVLELAGDLRLVGRQEANRIRTRPRFAGWRRWEPSRRAAELVVAWLAMGRVPTSEERDPSSGRAIPALVAPDGDGGSLVVLRRALLEEAGAVPGAGVTAPGPLVDKLIWDLPFVVGGAGRRRVGASWDEANHLGLVALGALTDTGRAALAGDPGALVESLQKMLPAMHSGALVGSDLTVVVPGSPAPAVVDLLDAVAVREARGSAATWRVTPESVRQALDEGHDAEDLLGRLRDLSTSDLPQALEYLVRDVARRHGHVGVQSTSAVVLGDDQALLAEIAASRTLRRLGLRQVAPNVLLSPVAASDVLVALRGAGYLPVPLDASGTPVVQVSGPSVRAADEGARGGPGSHGGSGSQGGPSAHGALDGRRDGDAGSPLLEPFPGTVPLRGARTGSAETPAEAAERLLRGGPPAEPDAHAELEDRLRPLAPRLTGAEVRHIAQAISEGGAVRLTYRSASGRVTERVVSDLLLAGPHLMGWCHLRQAERSFAVQSILAVVPA